MQFLVNKTFQKDSHKTTNQNSKEEEKLKLEDISISKCRRNASKQHKAHLITTHITTSITLQLSNGNERNYLKYLRNNSQLGF